MNTKKFELFVLYVFNVLMPIIIAFIIVSTYSNSIVTFSTHMVGGESVGKSGRVEVVESLLLTLWQGVFMNTVFLSLNISINIIVAKAFRQLYEEYNYLHLTIAYIITVMLLNLLAPFFAFYKLKVESESASMQNRSSIVTEEDLIKNDR